MPAALRCARMSASVVPRATASCRSEKPSFLARRKTWDWGAHAPSRAFPGAPAGNVIAPGNSGGRCVCSRRATTSSARAPKMAREGACAPQSLTKSRASPTICRMFSRNHRSIFVISKTSSTVQPRWNARPRKKIRSAFGTVSFVRSVSSSTTASCPSPISPKRLISSERSAFCSASLKVRPIAIASPTLFICVVSTGSACGNFSKVKRGHFTTT